MKIFFKRNTFVNKFKNSLRFKTKFKPDFEKGSNLNEEKLDLGASSKKTFIRTLIL